MNILPGQVVVIKAYPKEELKRRVVEMRPPLVLLTTEKEWRDSQAEKRPPICVGFPVEDVIRVED